MIMKVFCIELKDGRIFNIACANKSQIERFTKSLREAKLYPSHVSSVNGIHNIKQWEQIIKTL
jgi:acylphosphatase